MSRLWILLLGFALCLTSSHSLTHADEDDDTLQKKALALERLIQKTIADVEDSVVCIIVSRSGEYQRLGQGSASDLPGQLGRFLPHEMRASLKKLGLPANVYQQKIRQLDLASADHVPEAFGNGIVLDQKGLILTNYHVVRGAAKLYVRFGEDQGSYADIHAADPRSDLAVLRVLDPPANLKAVGFGEGEKAERGRFAVAVSYPHVSGFQDGQRHASWGIISNIRRRLPRAASEGEHHASLHQYGTLLQTDSRMNGGCSGGALFNLKGELIGMTTALAAVGGQDDGGCFAVPMTAGMKRIIDVLRQGQEVEYGFLGVRVARGKKNRPGVEISFITPGSPADKSGLKSNDSILAINGQELRDSDDLFLALGTLLAGSTARLEVRRAQSQQIQIVQVELAKYYVPGKTIAGSTGRPFFRGLRVDDTSLLVQQRFAHIRAERIPQGVVVCDVQPNSPAATILLKPGEIITHVNNQLVLSPREFYERVQGAEGPVQLTILSSQPGQPSVKVMLN